MESLISNDTSREKLGSLDDSWRSSEEDMSMESLISNDTSREKLGSLDDSWRSSEEDMSMESLISNDTSREKLGSLDDDTATVSVNRSIIESLKLSERIMPNEEENIWEGHTVTVTVHCSARE